MQIKNNLILDNDGRSLILRGVNLGGDSKIPFCAPGEETSPSFLDKKNNVSFIGRPFPVEEAEDHFKRLKKAGFSFLRFLVTWEAIEHEGPGIYDEAYLAYLRKILLIAEQEGISVFIDPHQDVWSRWTGGDGAPAWTMEKLGMNLDLMDNTGAAVTRQRYSLYHNEKPYPKMLWPSNYSRYAAATMFTLFFAGQAYAPDVKIEGENAQSWLQSRYIAAFCHAQRRLKNNAAVKGWGVMNEPHDGFIGLQNLDKAERYVIPTGPRPSPWQTMTAASGYTVNAPVYSLLGKRISHYETFNAEKVSLFREGFSCPWKLSGVWQDSNANDSEPRLLRSSHFSLYQRRSPVFTDDFLKPFIFKFINAVKESDEHTFFFIEGLPNCVKEESHPSWRADDPKNIVNAYHWYDGISLFTKSFRSWFNVNINTEKVIFGKRKVLKYFSDSLAAGINCTRNKMGNMPCFLGEFGLAFDLNNKSGFKKGNYKLHEKAISMYYDAADANLLHSTIWNYTAGNTNKYGDSWNDEDLSIFSEGKERAAAGWKRPYPMAVAGKLNFFKWEKNRKVFTLSFYADNKIKAPSVIFLPFETFGADIKVSSFGVIGNEISLRCEYKSEEQLLFIYNGNFSGEAIINAGLKKN